MACRLLGTALLCCAAVPAQQIVGTLYDRTGGLIEGARVMLMDQDYMKLAETKSGSAGEFSFQGNKPGLYFVQAKKPRFNMVQQHIQLEPGKDGHVYLIANPARGDDDIVITGDAVPGVAPAPVPQRTVRAGGKMEDLKLLSGRPPGFPESARKRGAHGTVVLLVPVRADGTLGEILTLESPDPELEKVSLDAVRQWRYAPMKVNGEPIEALTLKIFHFNYR